MAPGVGDLGSDTMRSKVEGDNSRGGSGFIAIGFCVNMRLRLRSRKIAARFLMCSRLTSRGSILSGPCTKFCSNGARNSFSLATMLSILRSFDV